MAVEFRNGDGSWRPRTNDKAIDDRNNPGVQTHALTEVSLRTVKEQTAQRKGKVH
jgi:hypothetical protein